MRLFAAIVPPEHVIDHLDRALTLLRGPDPGKGALRWTPRDAWHLTLAFYGEVPRGQLPELAEGLTTELRSDLGSRAFPDDGIELSLRGAGVFDRRTLWVGCGGDVGALAAVSAACVRVGERVTGRVDSRQRSRAHLTVARVRPAARRVGGTRNRAGRGRDAGPGPDVAHLARALAVYEGPAWVAEEVLLVESHLGAGPGGTPLHEVVERVSLVAGPAGGARRVAP